jgi:hypothetical protein
MKRWAVGSVVFFLSLGLGVLAAWLFFSEDSHLPSSQSEEPHLETTNKPSEADTEAVPFPFTPEFTNVVLDESSAKPSMEMEPVFEGQVDVCTADPTKKERKWLGLFKRGDHYALERRSVTYGPVNSTDFGSFSSMRFKDSKAAVFLLSDQRALKPGRVETLYIKPDDFDDYSELYPDGMEIGFRREFVLGEKNYVVRVAPAIPESENPASVLLIEQGSHTQIIWYKTYRDFEGHIGELDWVGDMDGDDRLDLKISYYRQNGGQLESLLFLSSFANEGKLLGFAASYSARCTEIAPDKLK